MAKGCARAMDSRRRVWVAWQQSEGSLRELARRFAVSLSFVRALSRRFRAAGSVAAKAHGGGQPLKAAAEAIRRLEALVAKHNDPTYDACHRRLCARGVPRAKPTELPGPVGDSRAGG